MIRLRRFDNVAAYQVGDTVAEIDVAALADWYQQILRADEGDHAGFIGVGKLNNPMVATINCCRGPTA